MQTAREAEREVVEVLEDVLSAVCRKEAWEQCLWQCPGGCARGSPDCARAAFRTRCADRIQTAGRVVCCDMVGVRYGCYVRRVWSAGDPSGDAGFVIV